MVTNLRKKAEQLLSQNPLKTPVLSTLEVQKLLHELDVHQVELQMQNENLRQAQYEISASRDTYAELYDFAPVGYLTLNPGGRIIEANFAAACLLGLERGQLIVEGRTFSSFVHRDYLHRWDMHHQHLAGNSGKQHIDLALTGPDKKELTVCVECTPHPATGQYLLALTDITQRVHAEEALKKSEQELALFNRQLEQRVEERTAALAESEARFRSTVNDILVGVVVHAADSTILFSNRQASLVLGLSSQQMQGKQAIDPAWHFVHEDRSVMNVEDYPVSRAIATGKKSVNECIGIQQPGCVDISWVTVSALPVFTQANVLDRIVVNFMDITARKQSEMMLAESEEKYRKLFESRSYAIVIFDGETRQFTDVNDAALALYGYTREEFLQLSHDAISAQVAQVDMLAVLAQECLPPIEAEHRKKDGTVFPIEATTFSYSLQGRPVVCSMILDITERVEHEQERENSREEMRKLAFELSMAEQRERERIGRELHDGVSQLLNSSMLRLQVLKDSPLPKVAVESLDTIGEIIKQALDETRSLTFELSCPFLNELGLAVALEELCSSMSHEYSIRFEFKGAIELLSMSLDRQIALYRSTRELLINVMKHAKASWVSVQLEQIDGCVRICVEDDGIGFGAETAGKGFSPSGGFGLFNIREYMRHAGGNLQIESIPGDGTQAVLSIPLETKLETKPETKPETQSETPHE